MEDSPTQFNLRIIHDDAVCYAERYPDLFEGFCNGNAEACRILELYEHYKEHGKELVWGCVKDMTLTLEEKRDAECYAKRYTDLFQGYCGGDVAMCQHVALYQHYKKSGQNSRLIWGCRDRAIVFAKAVEYNQPEQGENPNEDLDLHILVFETSQEKAEAMTLAAQSYAAGVNLHVFGVNVTFEGFGTKWNIVSPVLEALPDNALVAIVDGRDVLLNIHKDDPQQGVDVRQGFINSHLALTDGKPGAVVMSTEGQCCVAAMTFVKPGDYFAEDGRRNERACPSGEEGCLWAGDANKVPWEDFFHDIAKKRTGLDLMDVYLNAGLVSGKPKDLLKLIKTVDMEVYEDDQAVFSDFMWRYPNLLVLDYAQQMFGNARWTQGMKGGGCPFDRDPSISIGSLEHGETKSMPLFLHGPGKFFECLDYVAGRIGHGKEEKKAAPVPKKTTPEPPKRTAPEPPKKAAPEPPKKTAPVPKKTAPEPPKKTAPVPKKAAPEPPKKNSPVPPTKAAPESPRKTAPEPPKKAALEPPKKTIPEQKSNLRQSRP